MENISGVKMFSLSVLNETWPIRYLLFCLSLLVYMLIFFVNVMLILTITLEKALHEPMYILLCNLCINALYGTAGLYPKFLYDILSGSHMISYEGCLLQIFVIYSSAKCEFVTLCVMAYDRYVAICKPLMYHCIVTGQMICKLLTFCWMFPCCTMCFTILMSYWLPLCGYHIDKLYCENYSIVKLSCRSTDPNSLSEIIFLIIFVGGIVIIPIYIVFGIITILSYTKLISVSTKSKEDRIKFMQTCVPHLFALTNFTVAIVFDVMFARYGTRQFPLRLRNFLALQYLIIPPLFNPIMYGLKLTEIRKRLLKQCYSLK